MTEVCVSFRWDLTSAPWAYRCCVPICDFNRAKRREEYYLWI